MKHYSPTGRRNHGRPLKRLLDTWDWNGSTGGPTPWQIYDDSGSDDGDDDDDDDDDLSVYLQVCTFINTTSFAAIQQLYVSTAAFEPYNIIRT